MHYQHFLLVNKKFNLNSSQITSKVLGLRHVNLKDLHVIRSGHGYNKIIHPPTCVCVWSGIPTKGLANAIISYAKDTEILFL